MITEIRKIDGESLELAKKILLSHGVVGMPTETVYGLGAIGTDPVAVKKIYEIKGRPADNPLIAHVHKGYDIGKLVTVEREYVRDLMEKYMPGPLTLVLKSRRVVCDEATCGGDTLAIRMPSHEGCKKFLEYIDAPVVAPSANLSKHTSPVTAEHVFADLNGKIPLILDGGKCSAGIESTVLDVTGEIPRILRAGLVTREMIAETVGACDIAEHKEGDKVRSPGVKYRHYRPKCDTALYMSGDISSAERRYGDEKAAGRRAYIMAESKVCAALRKKGITDLLDLGASGEEIAYNLYDKLLEGEKKADIIIAVDFGREDGVYLGVTNRLRKSCG